jgi:hypothetical protein
VISGVLVVTTVCYYQCTRAAGAPGTRLSLLPPSFEGQLQANLGHIAPRESGRIREIRVKPASAGAGSGMYGTTTQIGNAAGVAAIGAVFFH